jgi:hypothetical protein
VLYDAALRNLQTLSEATQQLTDALKAEQPDVPWREISEFRNFLVHNYLGDIDPDTVAAVVDRHLGSPWHALLAPCCANPESIWVRRHRIGGQSHGGLCKALASHDFPPVIPAQAGIQPHQNVQCLISPQSDKNVGAKFTS